jgi:polysaccharide export outer membrane protein
MATKRLASTSVLVLAALVAGLTVPVAARQGGVQIAARDQLLITVSGSAELSRRVTVDVDGMFDYPYLGRVKAAGLTTRALAADLKNRLDPDYAVHPTVTVELAATMSKHFSIIGEVKAPGNYSFEGQKFLIDALAVAGSVTEAASDEALIIRGGASVDPASGATASAENTFKLDLYPLLNGTDLKNNVLIQDGDTINVIKARPVYITGNVKSVGAYPVRRGMTVSQAIALAGGVNEKGKDSGVKIERFDANGKKLMIPVKDIKTEIVKPGDTIVVPARIW